MSAEANGATRSAQHLSPGEGRALWWMTDLYIAKRVSEDTDGVFTLFEVTAAPQSPQRPTYTTERTRPITSLKGNLSFWTKTVRSRRALARWSTYLRLASTRTGTEQRCPLRHWCAIRRRGWKSGSRRRANRRQTRPLRRHLPSMGNYSKGSWPPPPSMASKSRLRRLDKVGGTRRASAGCKSPAFFMASRASELPRMRGLGSSVNRGILTP